eukprot:UN13577
MQQALSYAHAAAAIICVVWLLFALLYICFVDGGNTTKSMKIISLISIISYGLSSTSMSIRFSVESSFHIPHNDEQLLLIYINSTTWRIAQILTYILFIKRLKFVFKNTKYSSKQITYTLFYSLSVSFLMVDIIKDIFLYIWIKLLHKKRVLWFSATSYIISAIIDLILSITLMYLFMRKLWLLNKDISVLRGSQNFIVKNEDHTTLSLHSITS